LNTFYIFIDSGVSKAELGSAAIWIRSNKQPLKVQDETVKRKKQSKTDDD
jgi:hypothetical protein